MHKGRNLGLAARINLSMLTQMFLTGSHRRFELGTLNHFLTVSPDIVSFEWTLERGKYELLIDFNSQNPSSGVLSRFESDLKTDSWL